MCALQLDTRTGGMRKLVVAARMNLDDSDGAYADFAQECQRAPAWIVAMHACVAPWLVGGHMKEAPAHTQSVRSPMRVTQICKSSNRARAVVVGCRRRCGGCRCLLCCKRRARMLEISGGSPNIASSTVRFGSAEHTGEIRNETV